MSKVFGTPQPVDLVAKDSPTLTPGAAQQSCTFVIDATVPIINGNFVVVEAIAGCVQTVIDQPSSGGTAINGDDLPRIIAGINVKSPVLGTTHDRDSFTGPTIEHIWGWLGNGYRTQRMRNQVAAADGDTTIQHYFRLCFTSELFAAPHHGHVFLEWLRKTEIKFDLAASTVLDSLSTGAVLKATTTVRMWLDTFVNSELFIPPVYEQELYTATANAGTTHQAENVGLSGKWQGLETGGRIFAFWELTDQKGLGAADGADNILSYKIDLLQLDTVNIDAFFENHRLNAGRTGPVSGVSTTIVHDGAGNPEALSATPNGVLNSSTAMYTPVHSPGRETKISKLVKFGGHIKVTRGFTANPSSGLHKWAIPMVREHTQQKADELASRAGFVGGVKNMPRVGITGKQIRQGQMAGLPRRLIKRAA